jgi:hypoxanthine phosphoribosyltransferase
MTIDRVLYTEEQVLARIREVAAEMDARYAGRTLKLVAVLKGSVFFLTALARALTVPVKVDFLSISSFGASPGYVRIEKDLDEPIENEDVLLVEDIVDTGLTARYLVQTLAARGPNSLGIVTLLDRSGKRLVPVPVEFRGFEIPDAFVVGWGLDDRQLYRNLSCIATVKPNGLR